jgi:eukaryotic-like serine/threonine-protein kinase
MVVEKRAGTSTRFAWGPSAMDWRGVLDIGIAALERDWISPETLTLAVTLFRSGAHKDPLDLWIKEGLLPEDQAKALHRSIDETFTRALFAESGGTGRYVAERTINEGGMGRILVCYDRALGRRVAMKTLRHDMLTPENAEMLAREARVTGNLEHPCIIPVYDVGVADDEGPNYVMRLVEQQSLELVLAKLRERDPLVAATWTLYRLLRTFIQVCQAVQYAHSRDVIHCDLKPSNVLLGAFGEVLVSDWGMAYSRNQGAFINGGTPAYMAPEQFEDGTPAYDARTDVFALGVVLYRILCLRAPFRGDHVSDVLRQRKADQVPALPSTIAPSDRPVPVELEEIAMKAMESDPSKRFGSADELGTAVDAFLEGTRDREQRLQRAAGLALQGDELALRYHETRDERQKLAAELAALNHSIDPWAPLDVRRQVWDAEDELAITDALLVRILQEAISSYEQALAEQPKLPAARSGLARLYADRAERARERRSDLDRMYFEGLVRQYDDDGILVRSGGRPGWLHVEIVGVAEDIVLASVEERDRQLAPGASRRLRRTGLDAVPAAPGSYLLQLMVDGYRLRVPVLIRGERETQLVIDLEAAGPPRADEIYVPAGFAALGNELSGQQELRDVDVDAFFIQTFPVTFGSYIEFLNAVRADDSSRATRFIPWVREGVPLVKLGSTGFEPTSAQGDLGMMSADWLTMPAFGIDAYCAIEYAEWWSERTKLPYRLPTEHEWEKAARGLDGRRYPWGDRFEAIFCKMLHSRAGRPMPEPIGTFASDISPYGVRDMAGGVADWCTPTAGDERRSNPAIAMASRGGAWCDPEADCAVNARRRVQMDERSVRLGFRLVRDAKRAE